MIATHNQKQSQTASLLSLKTFTSTLISLILLILFHPLITSFSPQSQILSRKPLSPQLSELSNKEENTRQLKLDLVKRTKSSSTGKCHKAIAKETQRIRKQRNQEFPTNNDSLKKHSIRQFSKSHKIYTSTKFHSKLEQWLFIHRRRKTQ
jgi:uncharacterized membrane protein YhiD involved in acid resistance